MLVLFFFLPQDTMARLVLLALLVLMLSALALAQSGIPMSPCIVCADPLITLIVSSLAAQRAAIVRLLMAVT